MAKKKSVDVNPDQMGLFGVSESDPQNQNFTEEQSVFIEYLGKDSVILSATAGSGKTFSCVERLKFLLENGVNPSKIIFFSFTNAATKELQKRIGRDDIEIRTIHSFCGKVLTRLKKGKSIETFFGFIDWFRKSQRPPRHAPQDVKDAFDNQVSDMYEESQRYESQISAYKLQKADDIKCKVPEFWSLYSKFMYETKSRDFSDMLIEVRNLFKEDRYLRIFKNQYDYVFVDEYQDTSSIQMETLLALNAKYYYLIGDKNQSIYTYSGANCKKIENLLTSRRKTETFNLSVNFRSDINIIENSNKYSSLEATPHSKDQGEVDKGLLYTLEQLQDMLSGPGEIAMLVRTNSVIKKLEVELLKRQVPIRYFNYITKTDMKDFKSGKMRPQTQSKFNRLKKYYDGSENALYAFIKANEDSKKFITSIHKSKGLEFDTCIVVNSIAPDVLEENGILDKLTDKQFKKISFDPDNPENEESKNIHYVAVSRSKHKLHFMVFDV